MAGEAKSDNFMLGVATVMIGPSAELFDLTPEKHSIGLVKNFQMQSDPQYTDLTQGVRNTRVFSVMTNNTVTASMEVYEYTARNIAYGLGLDGSGKQKVDATAKLDAEVDGSTTPVNSITIDAMPQDSEGNDAIAEGTYIMISANNDDFTLVRKVTAVAAMDLTLDKEIKVTLPAGATVYVVNAVKVGGKENQPFFGAKVVGKLANGKLMSLLLPKVRITNGFNLQFSSQDYGNLPFEFDIYDLVPTDNHYVDFDGAQAKVLV